MADTEKPITQPTEKIGWKPSLLHGVAMTLAMRVGLGAIMALVWLGVKNNIPIMNAEKIYGQLAIPTSFPGDALLGVWPRWDGVHYLNLAMHGYFSNLSIGDSVYYPLYSILVKFFADLFGGKYIISGLVVSTISAFLMFTFLYRLGERFYGTASARWAVIAMGVFPTAVFFIAPFTESLFLALTIGAFLAAYDRRWWLAGLLGFLASLTRGPGMLTAAALAVLVWNEWRTGRKPRPVAWYLSAGFGLVMPVLGSLSFLAWRSAAGFPSVTEVLQKYSGLSLVDPLTGLTSAILQWVRVHDLPTTLDLWGVIFFLFLTVAMFIVPRWRKPEWLVYLSLNLILFLGKKSDIASSLQSTSRYVLVLFPVFLVVGDLLSRQSARRRFLYLVISTSLLIIFSALYTLWFFIG